MRPSRSTIAKETYWFPLEATVEVETPRQHWRNTHHFSRLQEILSQHRGASRKPMSANAAVATAAIPARKDSERGHRIRVLLGYVLPSP